MLCFCGTWALTTKSTKTPFTALKRFPNLLLSHTPSTSAKSQDKLNFCESFHYLSFFHQNSQIFNPFNNTWPFARWCTISFYFSDCKCTTTHFECNRRGKPLFWGILRSSTASSLVCWSVHKLMKGSMSRFYSIPGAFSELPSAWPSQRL